MAKTNTKVKRATELINLFTDRSKEISDANVNELIDWATKFVETGAINKKTKQFYFGPFLLALARFGIKVEFKGEYKCITPRTEREGEVITSRKDRGGLIKGACSNQEFFSFNVEFVDEKVELNGVKGQARRFMVIGYDGKKTENFEAFNFEVNDELRAEYPELDKVDFIRFHKFVPTNFANQLYSHIYVIIKLAIKRLKEQTTDHSRQINRLQHIGLEIPQRLKTTQPKTKYVAGQKTTLMEFDTHRFRIDCDLNENSKFPVVPETREYLLMLKERRRTITGTMIPKLQLVSRMVEYAVIQNDPDFFENNSNWDENEIDLSYLFGDKCNITLRYIKSSMQKCVKLNAPLAVNFQNTFAQSLHDYLEGAA